MPAHAGLPRLPAAASRAAHRGPAHRTAELATIAGDAARRSELEAARTQKTRHATLERDRREHNATVAQIERRYQIAVRARRRWGAMRTAGALLARLRGRGARRRILRGGRQAAVAAGPVHACTPAPQVAQVAPVQVGGLGWPLPVRCRGLRRAAAGRTQQQRHPDRRGIGHVGARGGRRHGGVRRVDDRLRYVPDRRPRQRLRACTGTTKPCSSRWRSRVARRRCGHRRQFRRTRQARPLFRTAPQRPAGESEYRAAASLSVSAATGASAVEKQKNRALPAKAESMF